MKKSLSLFYSLIRWLILLSFFLTSLFIFMLESPNTLFKMLETPLKSEGISYGKIEGSLLSGFILHNVNYKDQVQAKSVALTTHLHLLEERILYIDNVVLDGVQIDKAFLTTLIENNSTTEESNSTLPFDKVIVKNLDISLIDTAYDIYHVNYAKFTLDNFETDMKEAYKGDMTFILDSNVSQVNVEAKVHNEDFKLKGVFEGEQLFIKPFLQEQNLTLLSNPKVDVEAMGNIENIDFTVNTEALDIQYQHYNMHTKLLTSQGKYDFKNNFLKMSLESELLSNIVEVEAKSEFEVKLDDVNNSLDFMLKIALEPKEALLEEKLLIEQLAAQKIEINTLPLLSIFAKGDMQKVDFETKVNNFKATQNNLSFLLKQLELQGELNPLVGDVNLSAKLDFDSTVAEGNLVAQTKLNFNNLAETVNFEVESSLGVYEGYLNPLLEESEISLTEKTLVNIESSGNLETLKVNLDVLAKVKNEEINAHVKLDTDDIFVDLKKEKLKGAFVLNSNAENLALNVQSQFSGNYMKPKSLISNSTISVSKFDAFTLNLEELLPLRLNINTKRDNATVKLDSPKLKLDANTFDYEHIDFSINSDKIYPSKILELPKALNKKFIQVELDGDVTLSKQYFSLKGLLTSNEKFKANINAYSQANGLDVNIFTKYLKLTAKGDLENKNIEASVNIKSLKSVQKEFQSLYPFASLDIDGALKVDTKLEADKVSGTVTSPKLVLEHFNVEKLTIDVDYKDALLSIHTLNFNTIGFKEKGLTQTFFLNRKGFVNLGERKEILLDMHPKILLKGEGDRQNLKAIFQIEDLFLGYPNYGTTRVSCDIDYIQMGEKKKIIGGVFLDKLKVFYESKFLDPSFDNDVVIVNKKDKARKDQVNKETNSSFLNDTFIDLAIYAKDANYKTRDIDLTLDVNVKAQKEFAKELNILGKVEGITGRVEQAPKLFTVVDSNIVFQGQKEINPLLDLKVEHELPDILITINISGNAKRPKLTFTSEPPLPKKDILSYLVLGVSTAGLEEGKGSLGREAQLFIMNQAARDLAYEVELDRVFVKDDGTGEGYAVQVGKEVYDDTMMVIENSKEGNSFILEYDVSKNIKVEVGQHQKTVPSQSIDIYFRKKFK